MCSVIDLQIFIFQDGTIGSFQTPKSPIGMKVLRRLAGFLLVFLAAHIRHSPCLPGSTKAVRLRELERPSQCSM